MQRRTVTRKWNYRGDSCEGNSRGSGYVPTFWTYLLPTHRTTVITWAPVPSARCLLCIYTKDQWPPGQLTADGCHHRTLYGAHWHAGRSVRSVCRRHCYDSNGWQYLEPNLGCLGPGRLPHPPSVTGKTFCERAVAHTVYWTTTVLCSVASVQSTQKDQQCVVRYADIPCDFRHSAMNTVRNK